MLNCTKMLLLFALARTMLVRAEQNPGLDAERRGACQGWDRSSEAAQAVAQQYADPRQLDR